MARSSSSSGAGKAALLNPRTTTYEWGGPLGAFGIVNGLPLVIIGLNTLCSDTSAGLLEGLVKLPQAIHANFSNALPNLQTAVAVEVAWLVLHSLLYLSPLGHKVNGLPLRDGTRKVYNINAIHAYLLSHAVLFAAHAFGVVNLAWLAEMFAPLMYGAIIISIVMSVLLYFASFRKSGGKEMLLAEGGNTGSAVYDFWVGRELNPSLGMLDLKFMCELRPGLIGWSILNWAFVIQAYHQYQAASAVQSNVMVSFLLSNINIVLISIFESFYILDGLLLEAGIITMMDIVYDGFGFMLCFGDLAWVPFIYTLKTQYLTSHRTSLSAPYILACVALHVVGYLIFRGANTEKDRFRKNPSDPRVKHLKVMKTSAGKSLIISGYWGICRHPNYVGDMMMTLAWSLLTGTGNALPYFQPLYFTILLIHRQLRDEEQMKAKYGEKDWGAFCKIVKYRLIPFVY